MIRSFLVLALLTVVESSCHRRQVQIPSLPPAPAPSSAEAPVVRPAPQLPPPPEIAPAAPSTEPEAVIPTPSPEVPPPAAPKPTRRPAHPSTPAPAPAPAQPAAPAPAPQLAIVLTPDQERQYNAEIDERLQRAEASLRSIGNRQLNKEQQASVEETRNFIRQAQAMRATDLPGARRLAERAEVLARNLAGSLR